MLRLVCATIGCVPVVLTAWRARWTLLSVTALAVSLGIFSASTASVNVEDLSDKERVIGALNAIAAVLFALGCTMSIDIHRTIVGLIRVLWLVTLVTSSSGYIYIQELFPEMSFIPNDIAIGATVLSIVFLMVSIVVARFQAHRPNMRDSRAVVVEMALAAGALTLRFDDELYRIVTVHLGWAFWHLSCWFSVLVALYILDRPRTVAPPPRTHTAEVAINFEEEELPDTRYQI